jgi:Multiubiquitin
MPEPGTTDIKSETVDIFVNDNKVTFPTDDAAGAQIKAAAGVPADYSLYRRQKGSNEPIGDTEQIELKEGEHFFTRPPSNIS